MGKWIALAVVVATLMAGRDARAQERYKIIVNPANRVSSVVKTQVATFFLERTSWDDGRPVEAVDLPPASPVRESFSRDVLSMPVASVVAKWRTNSGFGRGDPPPLMATDSDVLAFVRRTPGAIGYISASAETQGVKVVSIGTVAPSAGLQQIVEVGGVIPMPERVTGVAPAYPLVARAARIRGEVAIEVVIGATGRVEQTHVVESVPMLDDAAIEAVKRWKYKPTVINGVPVPVKTKVRVAFTL